MAAVSRQIRTSRPQWSELTPRGPATRGSPAHSVCTEPGGCRPSCSLCAALSETVTGRTVSPPNPHVEVLAPRSSECGLCRKQVIADVISYEELVREQGDPHLNCTVILRKGETRTWKQHPPHSPGRFLPKAGAVLSPQQSQGGGPWPSPPSSPRREGGPADTPTPRLQHAGLSRSASAP